MTINQRKVLHQFVQVTNNQQQRQNTHVNIILTIIIITWFCLSFYAGYKHWFG